MTGQLEKAEAVFNSALADSTKDVAAWALGWRKGWGSLVEAGSAEQLEKTAEEKQ